MRGIVSGGINEPTGNAVEADLLAGKTASTAAGKITGTMPNNAGDVACQSSSVSGTTLKLLAEEGYTDGVDDTVTITDANFVAGKIKYGENVFGLTGTHVASMIPGTSVIFTEATSNAASGLNLFASTTYIEHVHFTIGMTGSYRISFDLSNNGSGNTVYAKLYKNDVAFGTERSVGDGGYTTFTEDLAFAASDKVSIYVKSPTADQNVNVRYFKVSVDTIVLPTA